MLSIDYLDLDMQKKLVQNLDEIFLAKDSCGFAIKEFIRQLPQFKINPLLNLAAVDVDEIPEAFKLSFLDFRRHIAQFIKNDSNLDPSRKDHLLHLFKIS